MLSHAYNFMQRRWREVWSSRWLVWWASSLIYGHHKSRFDEMSLNEWVGIVALMANVDALATSWVWLLVIVGSIHYLVSIDCSRILYWAHVFMHVEVGYSWVISPRLKWGAPCQDGGHLPTHAYQTWRLNSNHCSEFIKSRDSPSIDSPLCRFDLGL